MNPERIPARDGDNKKAPLQKHGGFPGFLFIHLAEEESGLQAGCLIEV